MELFLQNHTYQYAVEQILLTLFPQERPVYPDGAPTGARWARVSLQEAGSWVTASTVLVTETGRFQGVARVRRSDLGPTLQAERLRQRIIRMSFYRAAVRCLGKKPVWGALSGVRPARLMRGVLEETGGDVAAAKKRFMARYDVAPERAELCLDAACAAIAAGQTLDSRDVCLYVGIPFCPTRCAYCSFVSQSVEKSLELIPPFLDALAMEIQATGAAAARSGVRPVSLYIGGGTPTTLSTAELERLFTALEQAFDIGQCREITVEAGRPDTVTKEKLQLLWDHGVSRVSVNPQSMSDRVLKAIGRRHSGADVCRAVELVRATGAFQLNMDLIAGLPEDDLEEFSKTLEAVTAFQAENLTVHTLALKKGSRLLLEGTGLPGEAEVGAMLDLSRERLRNAGYAPYYLYRQKFMSGGFENVGWCRPGTENLYNICVMEERCPVLAMGAGASTKLTRGDGRLRRLVSPKYPREYIDGMEKIRAGKQEIEVFFQP